MRPSIIVAAYGPDAVTLGAVRRARAWPEAAASPSWQPSSGGRCRRRLQGHPRRPGGPGRWLRGPALGAGGASSGPCCSSTTTSSSRAEPRPDDGELARKGGFVVPWSNDVGMDHFCGPLPEGRQAAGRLRERAATLGAAPSPRVVRPRACSPAGRTWRCWRAPTLSTPPAAGADRAAGDHRSPGGRRARLHVHGEPAPPTGPTGGRCSSPR